MSVVIPNFALVVIPVWLQCSLDYVRWCTGAVLNKLMIGGVLLFQALQLLQL